jgi:hypothetical protein
VEPESSDTLTLAYKSGTQVGDRSGVVGFVQPNVLRPHREHVRQTHTGAEYLGFEAVQMVLSPVLGGPPRGRQYDDLVDARCE